MCLILFFVAACGNTRDADEPIALIWKDSVATGISVQENLVSKVQADSLEHGLTVHVMTPAAGPPVLGERIVSNGSIIFQPLVPFTRGLTYEIRFGSKRLGQVTVPGTSLSDRPELTGIFPSQDTLPQNLLKFYLQFSKPMREGQALQHLTLLKNGRDTLQHVFVDLQPELWNYDGTLLTLWLDPGRIKRGLQPNEKLGEPLERGAHYRLVVDLAWKDIHGAPLARSYRKDFVVAQRDTVSPVPEQWTMAIPEAGTQNPLQVNFHEPLDHVLIREAIRIYRGDEDINGNIITTGDESICNFTPDQPWKAGRYTIMSETRIEDLAGNNPDRVFDRDISTPVTGKAQAVYVREFTVR